MIYARDRESASAVSLVLLSGGDGWMIPRAQPVTGVVSGALRVESGPALISSRKEPELIVIPLAEIVPSLNSMAISIGTHCY